MIKLKPQKIECQNNWSSKIEGVIFVEKESDIDILFNELVKQDSYWEYHKRLIKVAPKEIEDKDILKNYCEYVGKTDIYEPEKIREVVDFIIFQYRETCCCC